MAAKPRIRVPAARRAVTVVAEAGSLQDRVKPVARYLRGDTSGILAMRRAVTRDAKIDVWQAAERASALAIDFMHNSGWIAGAVDQIMADTIGAELKLNAQPDLGRLGYDQKEQADWVKLIEAEWKRYAWAKAECDLAGKKTVAEMIDGVMRHYFAYGEAFGVLDFIPRNRRRFYGIETGTKVSLVAPHRLPRVSREFEGLDMGIFHDATGRPQTYRFRRRDAGIEMDHDVAARDVIHVMDRGDNPDSSRGITLVAPILKVVAQSDQLADATLATALMQTIFAATIKSPEPSEQAFQAIETLRDELSGIEGASGLADDLLDIWSMRIDALKEKGVAMNDPARINHLGPGEEFEMHTAATPGSQYVPYKQDLQREMARCLGLTATSFTMDHSNSTYSSVRMETATIWPIVLRRRERIAAPFAQGIFEAWLEEGIAEGRLPLKGGLQAFLANRERVVGSEWRGPPKPSADPYKDALADKVGLETGTRSLKRIYAEQGLDWEEETDQIALEIEKMIAIGMAVPHGRSRGGNGAGPDGAAVEGARTPAREDA
ncbi:MAG: phage portal protein [Aliihoeflea sp.]|uniref:phage portal protein n=1 Tax=Aliihoeflea sp. TaxID=2608088 RepID=UPI00403433A6